MFWKKFRKKGPAGRRRSDRKGNKTRQKNKRGDSKVESNDSPEIPDRWETADIPGLPSGGKERRKNEKKTGLKTKTKEDKWDTYMYT